MNERFLELDGKRIHTVTWSGTTGTSPPGSSRSAGSGESGGSPGNGNVLLVHGLGGSTISWGPAARRIAAGTGFDVTALDLPGFGRSRLPRGSAGLPTHERAVTRLLEEIGSAVIVGSSLGGLVALRVAATRPDLVDGLVLVAPALPAGAAAPTAIPTMLRFALVTVPIVGPAVVGLRRRLLGPERFVEERLRVNTADPRRVDPDVRSAMVDLTTERMGYPESARVYAQAARSLVAARRAAWGLVPDIGHETLVVHGSLDALVPVSLVDRLRDLRPDWRYEILGGLGHLPHLEDPDRFADVVTSWLREAAVARR